MELQFQKKSLPCIRLLANHCKQQELTQEVYLTDGLPDIGRVVGTWTQMLIRGKEWRQDSISVSGGVMVWTLYMPESENVYNMVESWVPFNIKVSIPNTENDGNITAAGSICYQDARLVSSRKIMLRIGISTDIKVYGNANCDIYEPDKLPSHIMAKLSNHSVKCPAEIGEKSFIMEERLPLPDNSLEISRILRYSVDPQILETKVLGRRLVFRGNALTHIMYEGANGVMDSFDLDIPFSQFTELDYDYEEGTDAIVCPIITNVDIEKDFDKMLSMNLSITGQYTVYHREAVSIVDDAYSINYDTVLRKEKLQLPMVDREKMQIIRAELKSDLQIDKLIDTVFLSDMCLDETDENIIGRFYILYYDCEGNIQNAHFKWEYPLVDNDELDLKGTINVIPSGKVQINDDTVLTGQTEIKLTSAHHSSQGIEMVSAIELKENKDEVEKPSIVLMRTACNDLWSLAKENNSSVDQICIANSVTEGIENERVLVIPVL